MEDKELLAMLEAYDLEAQPAHDLWLKEARLDHRFYRGEQWEDEIKQQLIDEHRPALTLNLIRSRVRSLVGYEQRSRYDMKAVPVAGGGDQAKAGAVTGLIKQVESENESQFIHSDMYRDGIIGGRGWVKIDVDTEHNLLGDITIETVPGDELKIDPHTRRYDLLDSRYIIREYECDEQDLILLIPEKEKEIKNAGVAGAESTEHRPRKTVKEFWYRTNEKRWYFIDKQEEKVTPMDGKDDPEPNQAVMQDPERFSIVPKLTKVMKFAVKLDSEILQKGDSPFDHPYFPYINYFAEFIREFDDLQPDTVGIVRDLRDPQREKNKRRSQYLDKLQREIASGYMYEDGAILNKEPLSILARRPWFEIKILEGKFDKVKRLENAPIDSALLQLDQFSDKDFDDISLITPAFLGQTEGSRESGKATAIRQQQGSMTVGPYQDNMRLTRRIMARVILALIGQYYTVSRMARILTDEGNVQEVMMNPEEQQELQGMMALTLDPEEIRKYDIVISETPTTPSLRTMQFFELMEMRQGAIPIPDEVVVKASDVPYKDEILAAIAAAKQQQAELAQQVAQSGAQGPR